MTRDETATLLADWLRTEEPFSFFRVGDGEIYWMFNREAASRTAAGDCWTPELGERLREAVQRLPRRSDVLVADYASRAPGRVGLEQEWDIVYEWLGFPKRMLHVEALLLHRESDALLDFYRAVREDDRPAVYFGNPGNEAAADLLRADFYPIPATGAPRRVDDFKRAIRRSDWQVVYLSAGVASKYVIGEMCRRDRDRTYVDLGSALDPYCRETPTRTGQLPHEQAVAFLEQLAVTA